MSPQNGNREKGDRLFLGQTLVGQPVPLDPGAGRLSFSTPYSGPLAEPNTWLLSFVMAILLHAGLLVMGKHFFASPPEYGIQSTAPSIEVTMVAALPEPVQNIPVPIQETAPVLPEAQSEIIVPKLAERVESKKTERPKDPVVEKIKIEKSPVNPELKGDGSSDKLGESETTHFSQASSETFGKTGKYQNQPPQYPLLAERNGWEGTVMLKAFVDKEGLASQVLVDRSSGYKILDQAALKAVKKWHFEPSRMGPAIVASWIKIPVRFRIEKNL